ncbi:MAG: hypothetical protein EU535_05445 [Promethearchaeota archaeon]|nr:MAG: hypothetical protein EU535_05445 [Candidatus Lokiarchaeota archaeon]
MMDVEYKDFMIFDIKATGDYSELKIKKEDLGDFLNPENVYAIINQEINRIYLWKGARSPVRKRFLGSRIATKIQGDMMKAGYKRCKIVTIDQGEELEEFLNVFGLESMEIKVELEDKKYIRNIEREQTRIASILSTKADSNSKLAEIQNYFDEDEQIIWNKSSIISLDNNWLKLILKNKKYKRRLTKSSEASNLEIKDYKNTYVITNKNIISYTVFNRYCDFSEIPTHAIKIKEEGEIIILDQRELNSFEIEEFEDGYDVWFNAEPIDKGEYVFAFEGLNLEEYRTFINALEKNFLAEIPEKVKKIRYIRKKR